MSKAGVNGAKRKSKCLDDRESDSASEDEESLGKVSNPTKKKRKCVFTAVLRKEFPFLAVAPNSNGELLDCKICKGNFRIIHRGRGNITDHVITDKHRKAVNSQTGSSLDRYFNKNSPTTGSLENAAKEAAFAFHTVKHELSFKTSDCTSKLIKHIYDSRFSSARTKTEAIICNVIAPFIKKGVLTDIADVNFLSVTIDSSNRKNIKLVPVVIRYFNKKVGVAVRLLEFQDLPGETSDILSNYIIKVLEKMGISKKLICFCADNTNLNFGGRVRNGRENIFRKLIASLKKNIMGIGCIAHILNNCVNKACEMLPIDIEVLIVKVFKHFHIYTTRVTEFQEFCKIADVGFKQLLSHTRTRFLSMLPALERILQLFEALKKYFLEADISGKSKEFFVTFFENEENEVYLMFLHGSLQFFHTTIKELESNEMSAAEASLAYSDLLSKLKERKAENFIPYVAKNEYLKLKNRGKINEEEFMTHISAFYDSAIEYMEGWESSFDGASKFSWINLTGPLVWSELEEASFHVNEICENAIDIDALFDEKTSVNLAYQHLKPQWDKLDNSEEEKCSLTNIQKWQAVFNALEKANTSYKNIFKLVEFSFCLPGKT